MKNNYILRDKYETNIYKWEVNSPIAVMQIVHGSGENASRYETFAKFLNSRKISVWAMDLRGHGQLAKERDELGFFHLKRGQEKVVNDLQEVTQMIKKKYKDVPYFMLGHSMGSFILREYAAFYHDANKFIFMGTAHEKALKISWLKSITWLASLLTGKKRKIDFFNRLENKSFNKKLQKREGTKTDVDWLSYNLKNRRDFLSDDLLGFTFTNRGYFDILGWQRKNLSKKRFEKISKEIPILLVSGKDDPVGKNGESISILENSYKETGLNVDTILYENMRHEILNEKEKHKVFNDIYNWLMRKK